MLLGEATVFASGIAGQILINTSSPIMEIQTGPTDFLCLIELFGWLVPNAISSNNGMILGLGVPATFGVGSNSAAAPLVAENTGDTTVLPGVVVMSQWTTPPTVPSTFLRRMNYQVNTTGTTNGQPFRFRFPQGLKIKPSSSLVLWNLGGSIASNWVTVDPTIVLDA